MKFINFQETFQLYKPELTILSTPNFLVKLFSENSLFVPCKIFNIRFQEKNFNLSRDQLVERQARDPMVRDSNPGSGSSFSLEI